MSQLLISSDHPTSCSQDNRKPYESIVWWKKFGESQVDQKYSGHIDNGNLGLGACSPSQVTTFHFMSECVHQEG